MAMHIAAKQNLKAVRPSHFEWHSQGRKIAALVQQILVAKKISPETAHEQMGVSRTVLSRLLNEGRITNGKLPAIKKWASQFRSTA